MGLMTWVRGLTGLFFPHVCLACEQSLETEGALLCISCETGLPFNASWAQPVNELTDRLAGRLPVTYAAAAYDFAEGTICQRLIHALKYHHRPDVGLQLGARFGEKLASLPILTDLDGIVPVPIHTRRRRTRGYNQAEVIAEGLASIMKVPVYSKALRRSSFRGSQTRRGKLERLANVESAFSVGDGTFAGSHLLLVDDVMTTGATLDFCGNALLAAYPGLRLSVATLAITERG